MTRKSVLLAGAGDLCRRAGLLLLAQGHQVWGLRRHPDGRDDSGIRWLAGDLTRPESLAGLPHGISHILYAPTPDSRREELYRAVFIDGLQNLLAALDPAALQRSVFISSSAVYGNHGSDWVDENTPVEPAGFNGRVLVEAEQWLAGARPDSVVFRLAGLYGPGRTELLTRLQQGRATVPRQGVHWANRLHIDDAARATVHLLDLSRPAPCYLGADNTPYPIVELYDALAALLKVAPAPHAAHISTGSKRLSNARLRASGFEPAWPDAVEGYRALIGAIGQGRV
jgi:nucleoside-diphosphate-sugar epimerase